MRRLVGERDAGAGHVRLGLRANIAQFSLLVGVNALVGGMLGQERTVLPLLAEQEFGVAGTATALTFIVAFGLTKAGMNFVAGALADRLGRKPVLVAGWVVGLPVPLLLLWAPTWGWIVAANVLLGVNQGLAWSTTVIMKIDLAGPERRGLAMGLNESAGYVAVSGTALLTGYIAASAGLRPEPFLVGIAYAGLGLALSTFWVRETRAHARHEAENGHAEEDSRPSLREVFARTSFRDRSLSSACQAGLVNNLNDGMAWGLLPIFLAESGLSVTRIGVVAAIYPAVWGSGQLLTGGWSDRIGRKPLIVGGLGLQALAIGLLASVHGFGLWTMAAALLGAGTAMTYPTLLAAVGDVAHPVWRASSVGVYRFWRDVGFAVGAVLSGVVADLAGAPAAIWTVAVLTAASGLVVAVRMGETKGLGTPAGDVSSSARDAPAERFREADDEVMSR